MSSSPAPHYLWAADPQAAWIPPHKLVENRYQVLASQLWLDTKSNDRPAALWPLPDLALPYVHLSLYHLHLPQLYGFCLLTRSGKKTVEIPLLDNVPIEPHGQLMPALTTAWPNASALQQAYWLWQLTNLWQPLVDIGVGYSLLEPKNIRVQNWRIRLCELLSDNLNPNGRSTVKGLSSTWHTLLATAQPAVAEVIYPLFNDMQVGKMAVSDLSSVLNQCLLEQAALLPIAVQIAGGTDAGHDRHNEDSFYPSKIDPDQNHLSHYLGIVCDGVAGHEGGEVASQNAVRSIQLQIQALLNDVAQESKIVAPAQIIDHLKSIVRVVNNLIAHQNDEQNREGRRRMATTMVMALQLPQQIPTSQGMGNSHEIYIAHVGDSRAYWLTRQSCQQLTVDDDVAQREIRQGKSMPWQVQGRLDTSSLTQALGIRSGEDLTSMVQRLIIIEDGVLLLCSDGFSDRQLIEKSWQNYVPQILDGQLPLAQATQNWIQQAAQENGHDNISLVLMSCQISNLDEIPQPEISVAAPLSSSRYRFFHFLKRFVWIESLLGIMAIGIMAAYLMNPQWFQRLLPQRSPTSTPKTFLIPDQPAVLEKNNVV
jgi:protein phosphatase